MMTHKTPYPFYTVTIYHYHPISLHLNILLFNVRFHSYRIKISGYLNNTRILEASVYIRIPSVETPV